MKTFRYIVPICCVALASCSENNLDAVKPEEPSNIGTVLTAVIGADTKTTIGEKSGKEYSILWAAGDKINVNGEESSEAVIEADAKSAKYSFEKVLTAPFSAVYPSSVYKSEGVVTIPSSQSYKAGTFDPSSAVLGAYSESGTSLTFHHLMAYLKLSFITKSDTDNIKTISVKSAGAESMSGDFSIDYGTSTLAPVADNTKKGIVLDCGESGVALGTEVIVAIPAQTYASGIVISTMDVNGDVTVHTLKSELSAKAGTICKMSVDFELYPGSRLKPIKVGSLLWAPVYCGYSVEHPNGLLYQYGRAKGQPYYPAGTDSEVCVAGSILDPADDKFYANSPDWYGGTALSAWPMNEGEAGYVEGKIGNPCPSGWRLPTAAELEGLLKIGFVQSTNWEFSANGTDAQKEAVAVKTGFTLNDDSGLFFAAVGGRASAGQSYYRGSGADAYARIWASDIKSGTAAGKGICLQLQRMSRSTETDGFKREIYDLIKVAGVSVRCVKNSE